MLRPCSPDLLPASAFTFPSPSPSLHCPPTPPRPMPWIVAGAEVWRQQKNAYVLLGETGTMGWRGPAAWAGAQGGAGSGHFAAELLSWKSGLGRGAACAHTHTHACTLPRPFKGSRRADSTRVNEPVFSTEAHRPGLRPDLPWAPALTDSL